MLSVALSCRSPISSSVSCKRADLRSSKTRALVSQVLAFFLFVFVYIGHMLTCLHLTLLFSFKCRVF